VAAPSKTKLTRRPDNCRENSNDGERCQDKAAALGTQAFFELLKCQSLRSIRGASGGSGAVALVVQIRQSRAAEKDDDASGKHNACLLVWRCRWSRFL
jgi:hypothetical protein